MRDRGAGRRGRRSLWEIKGEERPDGPTDEPWPKGPGRKFALLVGCTKYDCENIRTLTGPGNDVVPFGKLLKDRYRFADADVVTLSEGSGRRPTLAHIRKELERIAGTAVAGDHVVLLLSGHGSQQPDAEPFDEIDGLDEVFLPTGAKKPADTKKGEIPKIINGIVNDEIGDWLEAITQKKAYVCAVFDCCHSGNMDRGDEVRRQIPPGVLISKAVLDAARAEAAARAAKAGGSVPEKRDGWRTVRSEFLMTVSPCRADETTVEARLPARTRDAKYHGLLSYTLCEILTQAEGPLTYSELVHRIQVKYAGRLGGAPPPTVEGTGQDREVLGVKTWPGRSNIMLRNGEFGGFTVNAGELHGLTLKSILEVEGPAGSPTAGKRLGFVRVESVDEILAAVEPVEYENTPAPLQLPDLAVCRVVFTDYGARRIRLAIDRGDAATRKKILTALECVADPKTGSITVVEKDAKPGPDWLVRVSDGNNSTKPAGSMELLEVSENAPPFPLPALTDRTFTDKLEIALERIHRARNLLTVASKSDAVKAASKVKLEIEILSHKTKDSPGTPVPFVGTPPQLREGEFVSYRIHSTSDFKIDVTLLVVGTNFEVVPLFPGRGDELKASIDAQGTVTTPLNRIVKPFGPSASS